jgi:hypothetical protein
MSLSKPALPITGEAALARGAWTEAREAFEAALLERESPHALEGLGNAAWWLDLADLVFDSPSRWQPMVVARRARLGTSTSRCSALPFKVSRWLRLEL